MSFDVKDHYYRKAKRENYPARSVYKLKEIDNKFNILKRGMRVLDMGCFPGSWSKYASEVVGSKGFVVGIDILKDESGLAQAQNIKMCQYDIYDLCSLRDIGEEALFDVVLSDMAPRTSGIKSVDREKSLELVERVFALAPHFLRSGGTVVGKVFEGPGVDRLRAGLRGKFDFVKKFRPKATRTASKECFIIAAGLSD